MLRLASVLYSIVATSLAGSAVVAALVAGYDSWQSILVAAALGAGMALPVSYVVARAILTR